MKFDGFNLLYLSDGTVLNGLGLHGRKAPAKLNHALVLRIAMSINGGCRKTIDFWEADRPGADVS
jgi:hypothetical protein